ncbi:hypothetical protein DSCO28_06200 [Desulfosarcina ovata subsp. sediminis]|uniref:Uncharacterized protein n=1 Tax=Desulfosarcina ovata subsp. sediminis TaxID=885957 RepID=A0A5K7ZFH4_9BACT|nr:hypothetical protein [Desulfosarcina ovata]BBO80054.1 hypothetical protein DSCO28_06200 [Desulfosarcina ovata subsp. sediminis]
MKRPVVIHWIGNIVILLLLFSAPQMVSASDKDEQLRQTMADIALLNRQMAQRKADATDIRDRLGLRRKAIEEEIHQEIQAKGIDSQSEALENPRVFYDLILMAELRAYIGRYTQKIGYYRVACDRLGYLYQQADDDLKIIHTLSDLKIEALIGQVEKVLDGYLADAQTLIIKTDTLEIDPPEKIWASFKADR